MRVILPAQVTVILEHMFHPSEMEEEATLREDLEDDIKTECTKMGPVEKVGYSLPLINVVACSSILFVVRLICTFYQQHLICGETRLHFLLMFSSHTKYQGHSHKW